MSVEPRFARSAAFWLRAYPRRWRAERAAEVTAVLADLAPPGATRLAARTAAALVLAGWAARWREHPPPRVMLDYRLFGRRVPPRYLAWVRDDVDGPWYPLRAPLHGGWPVAAIALGAALPNGLARGSAPWWMAGIMLLWLLLGVANGARARDLVVRQQLWVRPGDAPAPYLVVTAPGPRRRLSAAAGLVAGVALAATGALAGAVAVLTAPRTVATAWCEPGVCVTVGAGPLVPAVRWALLAVVAAGLVLGCLLAAVLSRRLRTVPRPAQPHRELAPLTWSAWCGVLGCGLGQLVVAGAEASGRLPLLLGVAIGAVGAAAVPVLVGALRVLTADPGDPPLAMTDLAPVLRGRVPDQDRQVWLPVDLADGRPAAG